MTKLGFGFTLAATPWFNDIFVTLLELWRFFNEGR